MPASFALGLAYCGAPPDPNGIWTHWRLDPVVLTVLTLGCLAYFVGCGRLGSASPTSQQCALFYSGWTIVTLAHSVRCASRYSRCADDVAEPLRRTSG